jgi:hypothetical protein
MAPIPGDSSKHQFGTSMPQGGHPPHHSITSSAMASNDGGMVLPEALRGRLRYADRLRRPRWRNGQP